MPDPAPEHADVVKLHELLEDAGQTQQLGRRVLKAVILDILRSRLAGTNPLWCIPREGSPDSSVITVLQGLLDSVTLTEREREILAELENEQGG
jgi:hypothetical protein